MYRKAQNGITWWLMAILIVATLMPAPVGAVTPQAIEIRQSPTYLPALQRPAALAAASWPMAGANPQRTSWTSEEVRGQLHPVWFRPIEPFIPSKAQIIAANDLLYVSTAKGIYALRADTGALAWAYPTEMPLGHSPTIHGDTLYVGGFDHRLHAVEANPDPATLPADSSTGYRINNRLRWAFEAEAGFQTNPLVANSMVYIGNRDGHLYAVYANDYPDAARRGKLAWKYKTGGSVLYSAALSSDSSTVYFASNDMHAYALNALSGSPIWFHLENGIQKPGSAKLPGDGFHSWWPVVFTDPTTTKSYVILAGSHAYRSYTEPRNGPDLQHLERLDIFGNYNPDDASLDAYRGSLRSPRLTSGSYSGWLDTNRSNTFGPITTKSNTAYFKEKPWRRTYFVLDALSGEEATFDFDNDGRRQEYAPILWHGTHSGNRYPPVVGNDTVLYQSNLYMFDRWIGAGQVSGWKFGTPYISTPSKKWAAMDEAMAYSAGGSLVYWTYCCDRGAGAVNVAAAYPNTQEWTYFDYNIDDLVPGYNVMHDKWVLRNDIPGPYGGPNGVYSVGEGNPPIPYKGMVYLHRSNAILAFGMQAAQQPLGKPVAQTVSSIPAAGVATPGADQLRQRLAAEVQAIIDAGHLRPGRGHAGLFDGAGQNSCGDHLMDYWIDPSDTIYTLLLTLPHLPADLQARLRSYIQSEMQQFSPAEVTMIGWKDGASRDFFDLPPEEEAARLGWGPTAYGNYQFEGWTQLGNYGGVNPFRFYALWKYSLQFTSPSAQTLFSSARKYLSNAPSDAMLTKYPFVHNAYIAGYRGYLELGKRAGYQESQLVTPNGRLITQELERLLALRAATFTADTPYVTSPSDPFGLGAYCRTLTVSRNFMHLTPEVSEYLRIHAGAKVALAAAEYYRVAPYWLAARTEQTMGEGVLHPIYDANALFQAKAQILRESREELAKHLDVPMFARGDLFYIQNLVSTIEAPSAPTTSATIALRSGWNLVGLPLSPADPTPASVFAPIAGQLSSVYSYDGCDTVDPWKRYDPLAPPQANDLTSVDVRAGLWIEAKAGVTLTITGVVPTGVTVPLCLGDNLIAYPSSTPQGLPDAFASIAGSYGAVYGYDSTDGADPWKTFYPNGPGGSNDLTMVESGSGYWVEMSSPGVLQVIP